MLPKDLARLVPKSHLMTESEWRAIGVQQSRGWVRNVDDLLKLQAESQKNIVERFLKASMKIATKIWFRFKLKFHLFFRFTT